jgi:anti-sigma factor RsiW
MAMSNTTEMISERDEIEMLLPWYVTGKLDAPDRARVDAWLRRAPDLARQLDLIRAEQDESLRANEALRAPASLTIERTMTAAQGSMRVGLLSPLTAMLRGLFTAPSAGSVRWAAAAAGVVMLLQAAAVGYLLLERPGTGYQQAGGGPVAAQAGTFALVRFADAATAKDIAAALADLDMTVVEGPRQGALFRVKIGAAGLSEADRDARIDALRRRAGLVVLVTPSP